MKRSMLVVATSALLLLFSACASQPAAPTAKPAAAQPTAAVAQPTAAPVAPVAQPTIAPAAPATAAPAVRPAEQSAAAIESFYKGKTVTILVGMSPGGGHDTYARIISRSIGKYIPGNPTVIVENKPGAGSMVAANHIYNVAPKDGTVFGTFDAALMITQILGDKAVQYDASKFAWIGSPSADTSVCVARKDSPVQTFDDASKMSIKVGGSTPGSVPDTLVTLMNNLMGTKFALVSGFPGSNDIIMAIERNELQGFCGWTLNSLKSSRPNWYNGETVNILVETSAKKTPELAKVPFVMDYVKDEKVKSILGVVFAPQAAGRAFAAPPGTPSDRVDALRKAFASAAKDPTLLDEIQKAKLAISPVSGEELQKLADGVVKTPKDQSDTLAKYMK